MTTVIVATENDVKVQAVAAAFTDFFDETINVDKQTVSSDVPKQPVNSEIVEGAENRLVNVKTELGKKKLHYDYIVSIEAGIMNFGSNWYNIQYVVVEDKDGRRASGISQGFPVPFRYVEEAKVSSINAVLGNIFGTDGEGLSTITHGIATRLEAIQQGTVMALSGLLNGEAWY